MDGADLQATRSRDVAARRRVSAEDLAIAALVMLPFTLTLAVLVELDRPGAEPACCSSVLAGPAAVAATFWNAGWRARTARPWRAAANSRNG